MDYSPPGFSIHGILQARVLEWGAIAFSLKEIGKETEVAQSCLTLCDPMDCSLPGFSIHGILQARILKWVTISFSRDLPDRGIEPTCPVAPAVQETWIRFLGQEDLLEKEMATHSSILA